MADKIKGGNVEIDDTIEINDVLLVGSRVHSTFGRPYVPGAKVIATVETTAAWPFLTSFCDLLREKRVVLWDYLAPRSCDLLCGSQDRTRVKNQKVSE